MSADELADEVQAEPETVIRTLRRYKRNFVVLQGGYYGLAQGDT